MSAAAASAFQYIIPLMSVVFAAIFLHEVLPVTLVVAGLLVLVGLVATQAAN
jgi:drug/metabolite transporter (DMT)-like permease